MIIGLHGNSGCGKDTLADCLVEQGYFKLSFAAPLKRIASVAFNGLIDFNESGAGKDLHLSELNGHTRREVLLFLDGLKQFDNNLFFNRTKSSYEFAHCDGIENFIFSDVRYEYERNWIVNELGGIIININDGNMPSKNAVYKFENVKNGDMTAWLNYIKHLENINKE